MAACLTSTLFPRTAAAQLQKLPEDGGQWAGPWGAHDEAYYLTKHREIAHAVVLPNESPTVVFWCLNDGGSYPETAYKAFSFIWRASDPPGTSTLVDANPPQVPPPAGNTDWAILKGGGTAQLADGRIVETMVPDLYGPFNGGPENEGSVYSYVYDLPSASFPHGKWTLIGASPTDPLPTAKHWYPSAITLRNGDVFSIGHDNDPTGSCTLPEPGFGPPCNASQEAYQLFARNPITGAYAWDTTPKANIVYASDCSTATVLRVHQYPRIALLSNNQVFYANGRYQFSPAAPECDPAQPCDTDKWSCFALLNQKDPLCANQPRWRVRLPTGNEPCAERCARSLSNLAHYIWYDTDGAPHDSLYHLAGSNRESCSNTAQDKAYGYVDRIVDPTPTNWWNNSGNPPDLHFPRKYSETVLLLDGSMVVFHGLGPYDANLQECPSILVPEQMQPVEAFGPASALPGLGSPMPVWQDMNVQYLDHHEHAVAVLLPDGRVWVAGGKPHYHKYGLFSPPYFFKPGRPPVVILPADSMSPPQTQTWRPDIQTFLSELELTVRSYTGQPPARYALVRLASATHGFDMGQRYVNVRVTATGHVPVAGSANTWTVRLIPPPDGAITPPGYYWLAAIDTNGKASNGRLILMQIMNNP